MTYTSGNQLIDCEELFLKAQVRPGMHLADLGCGRVGHIVFPAAALVGERGIVYAVDVLKDVLTEIKKRAAMEGLVEVQTVWTNLETVGHTAVPARSLDAAFIINVLNQSDNRHAILEEAHRLLKNKARLLVVDWQKRGLPFAPPAERYVNFTDIKNWSALHGFVCQEEFDMGPYHHGLVLFKHD
jgi:ubiquinone/menaquinone biosynthesis C-methylase UbiE